MRIVVTDTGAGIPKAVQDRLFEPFVRGDASAGKEPGYGLGLSIVARLVKALDGTIRVESEVGAGSRFVIDLPFARAGADPDSPEREPLPGAASRAPLKILVAEDSFVIRTVLRMMLQGEGHEVVAVEDGADALDAVRRETFDLAIIDLQMPVMNGHDAIRRIRALPQRGQLPIIVLTGMGEDAAIDVLRDLHVEVLLRKPVRTEELQAAIDRAIPALVS